MQDRTRGYLRSVWLMVALVAASAPSAHAQLSLASRSPEGISSAFLERQRALERENQRRLQRELPVSQKFRVDWGGWFNSYFFLFDDGVVSSRTLRQNELRLWASFSADRGIHRGYARMRLTYDDWNAGDSFTRNEDDLDGPNLERGWYEFDIAKAVRTYGDVEAPFELKMKLGRDLVHVGTGYAVDTPLDHVMLQGELFDFETTLIGGRTPMSTENIDRSRPVADHSNRVFYVVEERYKGWSEHEPFVYVVWQEDHTEEDPPNLLQQYRYNSRYIGWGSTGELVDNLRYSTEWVIERGRSYGDRRFIKRNKIRAWGFDNRLDYFFRHKTKPVLSAEWMFASGDAGRLGSPTNAAGGNRGDFVDHSFVGFGFRDTGIAFSPRLSNIHVWRLGGTFRPFPDVECVKDLEVGTDWYLYYKNRAKSAVSDGLANLQSGYLGWEMDYFANYRIVSDLSWTIRFGTFFPGRAFSDRTTRTFLLTGVTWSF
ncbi:MAG: alginate export family protein [Phycisphaerae bacterium]